MTRRDSVCAILGLRSTTKEVKRAMGRPYSLEFSEAIQDLKDWTGRG